MLLFMADTLSYSDRRKLEIMYDRYKRKMYAAAKSVLGGDGAEDAVQNAFVCIAKNMDKINVLDSGALEGYVIVIAKNEAYNILRKEDKAEPFDEAPPVSDPFSDVDAKVLERDAYEKTVSILRSMDDTYRAPLYLRYVMGYSVKETARLLKRNEQTVKGQLARGKKMIISQLKEAGYEY